MRDCVCVRVRVCIPVCVCACLCVRVYMPVCACMALLVHECLSHLSHFFVFLCIDFRCRPNVILGVTNPFFTKALQHWPHVVRLDEGAGTVGLWGVRNEVFSFKMCCFRVPCVHSNLGLYFDSRVCKLLIRCPIDCACLLGVLVEFKCVEKLVLGDDLLQVL